MTPLKPAVFLAVLAVSLWPLTSRRLRHDLVGLLSALVLVATGVVTPFCAPSGPLLLPDPLSSSPFLLFLTSLVPANLAGNMVSAALLGPLAVSSPLLDDLALAVAMGASSTFLAPFSHTANLIAYSAGSYEPQGLRDSRNRCGDPVRPAHDPNAAPKRCLLTAFEGPAYYLGVTVVQKAF